MDPVSRHGVEMQKEVRIKKLDGEFDVVVVKKLALGEYAQLLKAVKTLPREIVGFIDENEAGQLKDINLKDFVPTLLPMIADSIGEFCEVLSIATDKDGKYFETQVDLAEGIEILVAALELNDFQRVQNSIKKLTARKTKTKADQVETPPQTEIEEPAKT